jgi:deazaflavin-dependent oxidoreductase (nitroreductase family)
MVTHMASDGSALATLYRLPLWLHGFGIRGYERLLGIDWIVLTTRGRRSGAPRDVMLDAIGHDTETGTWYVQPADEARAHWLRNLRAHPIATVEVRGRRFEARATEITGPAGAEVVLRFIRTHPWYARLIVWMVGYVDGIDLPDDELLAKLRHVVVVALHPLPAAYRRVARSAGTGQAEHPLG